MEKEDGPAASNSGKGEEVCPTCNGARCIGGAPEIGGTAITIVCPTCGGTGKA